MNRERTAAVLALLAAGALAVLASTQTWVTASLSGAKAVTSAGSAAAPALTSLGLVLLAGAGALAIAGRVARIVVGVVVLILAVGIAASAIPVLIDPISGVAAAVTTATGVAGSESVRRLVTGTTLTLWPWVGLVGAAIAAAAGGWIVVRASRWSTGGRRYDRNRAVAAVADPVDEWDALTRGTDPTEPH